MRSHSVTCGVGTRLFTRRQKLHATSWDEVEAGLALLEVRGYTRTSIPSAVHVCKVSAVPWEQITLTETEKETGKKTERGIETETRTVIEIGTEIEIES